MLKSKNILLKKWLIDRDVRKFVPNKGIEVKWQQSENDQCFATLIARRKAVLEQQASQLPILSERCRTLKNLPKMRIINSHKVRIN